MSLMTSENAAAAKTPGQVRAEVKSSPPIFARAAELRTKAA
jgi:hypothetical protein